MHQKVGPLLVLDPFYGTGSFHIEDVQDLSPVITRNPHQEPGGKKMPSHAASFHYALHMCPRAPSGLSSCGYAGSYG